MESMKEAQDWNKVIYKNEDGSWADDSNKITVDELWDKWQIKSWPKFKDGCACHVPSKWADDVRVLLTTARNELGDRVNFSQIKEKFCRLTIYYKCDDDEATTRMQELISECIKQLQLKKVYPITKEDYAKLIKDSGESNGQ